MMAELTPPWGKFGQPSGQVCPGLLSYTQTLKLGIAKGKENVTAFTNIWTLRVGSSECKLTKTEPEIVVLNCLSFFVWLFF